MFIFHLFASVFASNPPAVAFMTKVVDFNFYISPYAIQSYRSKGHSIEEFVEIIKDDLEHALNSLLVQSSTPMSIKFNPIFYTETPGGIDLDKCGLSMTEIGSMLNAFNMSDPHISSIVVMSCDASPYNEVFNTKGLEVPYVSHNLSIECSTRIAVFFENEEPKFKSVIATAMMKAAGVLTLNPLKFEEITDGDQGVRYEIRATADAIKGLKENKCFFVEDYSYVKCNKYIFKMLVRLAERNTPLVRYMSFLKHVTVVI